MLAKIEASKRYRSRAFHSRSYVYVLFRALHLSKKPQVADSNRSGGCIHGEVAASYLHAQDQ